MREQNPNQAQENALRAPMLNLNARSGNGAVVTGAYTLLVSANYKRRWFSCQVPKTEADSLLLVFSRGVPGAGDYGQMLIEPGGAIVLDGIGGMPWQGSIYGTGLSADSYCYWTETEDYP